MISVENIAEKRIFHLKRFEDNIDFNIYKNELIKAIYHLNHRKLNALKKNPYNTEFSVFIFYDKIQEKIQGMSNSYLKTKLLGLDWYKILIGDIRDIRKLIKDNNLLVINTIYKKNNLKFKEYKDIFENLYEDQLSSKEELKKQFFNLFKDLNVCPYCNRNFINPIYKNHSLGGDNKKQSPDIEHFFPKSIYPFLSLSISNLLPSCAFCNKIKHNVDTYKHNCLSPYEIKNNDFRFEFNLKSEKIKEVKIITKNPNCKNSEILHLETLYNEIHGKYINDIFDDVLKYPKSYKESLKKFETSEADYKRIFRNYFSTKDFNKHPLSKMTKELISEIRKYSK